MRSDSGRGPSLEPLKLRVPNKPCGDSGLERCGDCAIPTTLQTFSNPAGFGDRRGRATYLTALRIKEFSIYKGSLPRRAACSCKSRSLVLNKRTAFCFAFGAAGAFRAPTKDACGPARWEVGCARALPAVSELPTLAAVAQQPTAAGRRPADVLPSRDSLNAPIRGRQRPGWRVEHPAHLGGFGRWELGERTKARGPRVQVLRMK